MKKIKIPFSETGYFSDLILKYLDSEKELKEFYNQTFTPESFAERISLKAKEQINRDLLFEELSKQYAHLNEVSDTVRNNILSIKNQNTFTITTGHQLCLLSGPLYVIYKILTKR